MQYLIIIIFEIIITGLFTKKISYIAQNNRPGAMVISFLVTCAYGLNLLIIIEVQNVWGILAMAIGATIGTYVGMIKKGGTK